MKKLLIFISILSLSITSQFSYGEDKVDLSKLRQSRQQGSSSAVVSKEVIISLDDRKKAYEQVKDVQHQSIVSGYAQSFAQDLAESSKNPKFILVNTNCTPELLGFCLVKNITLKGPPNVYIPENYSASPNIGIHQTKSDNDYIGNYHYTLTLDIGNNRTKVCTGSFRLNRKHRNIYISVYQDSCEGNISTS